MVVVGCGWGVMLLLKCVVMGVLVLVIDGFLNEMYEVGLFMRKREGMFDVVFFFFLLD